MALHCPVCGSADLIPDLAFHDGDGQGYRSHEHQVEVVEKPTAIFSPGKVKSELRATVCGACGYTMFFARDYGVLWRTYQESRKRQQ